MALALMGVLAGLCLPMSALTPALAWPLAFLLPAYAAWCARRDWRVPAATLVWRLGAAEARLLQDGRDTALAELTVRWRGPLATLGARDEAGKLRRLSWWPDTLPPPARRTLRLLAEAAAPRPDATGLRGATGATP
jgi:toxin CptA